ncbi:unnamed protein product [Arabis nemorensis]|uniref:Uncharacterized protein n=1 Tax=Arabis nemorensis TaxID=586526 RepID=A0A565BFI1_9BRAS|nr:unnamed protein product [Arabis nemorensis]
MRSIVAKWRRLNYRSLREFDTNTSINLECLFGDYRKDRDIPKQVVDKYIKARICKLWEMMKHSLHGGPVPFYRVVLLMAVDKGYTHVLERLRELGFMVLVIYPRHSSSASCVYAPHLCDVFDKLFYENRF